MPLYLIGLSLIGVGLYMLLYELHATNVRRDIRAMRRRPVAVRSGDEHPLQTSVFGDIVLVCGAAVAMMAGGAYMTWLGFVLMPANTEGMVKLDAFAIGVGMIVGQAYFVRFVRRGFRLQRETTLPLDHLPAEQRIALEKEGERVMSGEGSLMIMIYGVSVALAAFGAFLIYFSVTR